MGARVGTDHRGPLPKGGYADFLTGNRSQQRACYADRTRKSAPLGYPFPYRPFLHPTHLTGSSTEIISDATTSGDIVFDFHHMSVSIANMLLWTNDAFGGYAGAQISSSAGSRLIWLMLGTLAVRPTWSLL